MHEDIGQRSFAWQEGYAAFTVSSTVRDAVRKYISNQKEQHRLKSFREEFVELLEKAGVERPHPGVSAYGLNPRLMACIPPG